MSVVKKKNRKDSIYLHISLDSPIEILSKQNLRSNKSITTERTVDEVNDGRQISNFCYNKEKWGGHILSDKSKLQAAAPY